MSEESPCDVCKGTKKNIFNETCPYCNGTGEWNDAASSYMKSHICQCINWDRENCPICMQKCHHDTSQTPKQKIIPGYGGMTATISYSSSSTVSSESQEEELITA